MTKNEGPNLQALDEQKVIENGQVLCCIGLCATLYFQEGHSARKRQAILHCLNRYMLEAGPHLRWGRNYETGRPVDLRRKPLPPLKEWIDRLGDDDELELAYHGGLHKQDADNYSLDIFTPEARFKKLSYFSMTLPVGWIMKHSIGEFVRLVYELCEQLQPYHGYAGFAAISSVSYDEARKAELSVYALARRFPGLEVDYPISHLRHLKSGIKGVNWLTILSDHWTAAVGGKEYLRTHVDPSFFFYDFPGGTIIQAGPSPQLGNSNTCDVPSHYRTLSRLLKPIRVNYPDVLHANPDGFNETRTREWFSRFD